MSRFIDKLNQVSRVVPQSMGFRRAQPVSLKPKILLIASLAEASVGGLADYVAGADAGLLRIPKLSSGAKTLGEMSQAAPDIPWGGWLRNIDKGGIKQMVKAGCDFVVFPAANTPLALLQNDEIGKILEVEPSLSEGLLRAVNELSIDAVLIAGEQEGEYFLTWHHLMLFQCFADLLTKHLLASIPSNVTANELQALWEAGVDGVVIKVGAGQPVERLKELRQTIDKLVFPSQRKRKKAEVLLPYISRETGIVSEDEE
ncbi:MAG: hypothetical protein GH152_04415 [Dehalococcoidia bacterium]|nr:hypothetical protein [Dehalococcoidia bacterium]